MREIKFRVWDEETKSWCVIPYVENNLFRLHSWQKPMQFTGLLDRHGVEIYEGDIVKHFLSEKRVGEVFYHHASFTFRGVGTNPEFPYWDDMKVIGNIYQNPELLK